MVATTIDEKVATVRFRVDVIPHIILNAKLCKECEEKACIYVCPANLFTLLSDGEVMLNYEHCLECGACAIACCKEGAIHWSYPRGGFGVTFRQA
jgi:ferredoxin like protein